MLLCGHSVRQVPGDAGGVQVDGVALGTPGWAGGARASPARGTTLTSNIFSMSVYLVFSSSPQEVRLQ